MTEISSIGSVRTTVEVMAEKGIAQIVLSPGSRNAPFVLSFTAMEEFECISMLDERSAAFAALGMAQQSGKPAVICCTSGSAMLNYAPALVEAYYQGIPVIALTADRPDEWIDQGEGQSIRQRSLLDGVVLKSFHLTGEQDADDQWFNQRQVSEALEIALRDGGPVHINVPLREPLYELKPRTANPRKGFKLPVTQNSLSVTDQLSLVSMWSGAASIVILVSQGKHPAGLQDALKVLCDDPRVAVLTETTANVQYGGFVSCIDRTIESFIGTDEEINYVPELLITIGENIVSKKLKSLFRRHRSKVAYHWHLGKMVMDTFQSLTHVLPVAPDELLRKMSATESAVDDGRFGMEWRSRFLLNEQLHQSFLETAPYSDLKVFETILDFIPDGAQVQMGNSSVVRYFQLFQQFATVKYHGNRGVSGIEGCVSTAVGAAINADTMVLHISGDHAFRYDSNALGMAKPANLRVIVINNAGGNIFRIIPGPTRHEASDQFIEASNDQSIEKLVRYHEVDYLSASDLPSLEQGLEELTKPSRNRCAVLEVFTPRELSPEVLKAYFEEMR